MSKETQQLFSNISASYDQLNHLLSLHSDRIWRKRTIQAINAKTTDQLVALDLCAGTLDLSLNFLNHFPHAHVYSLDFSLEMLDKGATKIGDRFKERIHLVCGDALSLPFADNSFDIIFCGYGFRNLDHYEVGLQEIHRVLKPTGQILILEFFRPTNIVTKAFFKTYGKFLLPYIGGLISGNRKAYTYLGHSISRFYSLQECKKVIETHGFDKIKSKNFCLGVSSLISGNKTL